MVVRFGRFISSSTAGGSPSLYFIQCQKPFSFLGSGIILCRHSNGRIQKNFLFDLTGMSSCNSVFVAFACKRNCEESSAMVLPVNKCLPSGTPRSPVHPERKRMSTETVRAMWVMRDVKSGLRFRVYCCGLWVSNLHPLSSHLLFSGGCTATGLRLRFKLSNSFSKIKATPLYEKSPSKGS